MNDEPGSPFSYWYCVVVYFDDILIYSATSEAHLSHLRAVLEILQAEQFFVAPKKCVLHVDSMFFLGYLITSSGIRVRESKVVVIRDWSSSSSVTEARSFHGLASFYHHFIIHFSTIMALVTNCIGRKPFV